MNDSAFFTAVRFYARVLAGVLAVIGFFSIIALQAGWLAFPKAEDTANGYGMPVADAEEPPLIAEGTKILMSQLIPVDPGLTYDLSAEMRSTAPPDLKTGAARTYLGVVTYDENGKELRSGPGTYRYAGANNFLLYNSPDWRTLSGTVTGEGDETHNQFRPGTRYVRIVALLNYRTGNQTESGSMTSEIRNVRFAPRVKMNLKN